MEFEEVLVELWKFSSWLFCCARRVVVVLPFFFLWRRRDDNTKIVQYRTSFLET